MLAIEFEAVKSPIDEDLVHQCFMILHHPPPQPLALTKGQAEGLRNHLLAKGAQVSNAGNEPTKQTAEASSENR